MTENEIILEKQIADDLSAVLKEAKAMGCREVACFRHIPLQNVEAVIQALEEIQQYRAIGTVEDIQLIFQLCKDLQVMCGKYHAIGTVEDIQQKLAELERWHATEVNPKIKNVFANTSTQICHNCDHKDEYIEELEAELQALKEKAEPKKPNIIHKQVQDCATEVEWKCPVCGRNCIELAPCQEWCADCGQKLDWS